MTRIASQAMLKAERIANAPAALRIVPRRINHAGFALSKWNVALDRLALRDAEAAEDDAADLTADIAQHDINDAARLDSPRHFIRPKTRYETRHADLGTRYSAYPTGCGCGCGRTTPCEEV